MVNGRICNANRLHARANCTLYQLERWNLVVAFADYARNVEPGMRR
jgi:hypothetical protein